MVLIYLSFCHYPVKWWFGVGRLLFTKDCLSCLQLPPREARRCLEEWDLGMARLIVYNTITALSVAYGCQGPLVMMMPTLDRVYTSISGCEKSEEWAWEVAEALERLPGVWFVVSRREDGRISVETIPYRWLYHH